MLREDYLDAMRQHLAKDNLTLEDYGSESKRLTEEYRRHRALEMKTIEAQKQDGAQKGMVRGYEHRFRFYAGGSSNAEKGGGKV